MTDCNMEHFFPEKGIVYEGDSSRLTACMEKAKQGQRINLAFLGGSITQGARAENVENSYAHLVYCWWKSAFPQADITYINAGIGGTTSHLAVARVEEEVLRFCPDFVVVDFTVNDADSDMHFMETYEGLIRRILYAGCAPALLLLYNVRYNDGGSAEDMHQRIGSYYQVPGVSMRYLYEDMVKTGLVDRRTFTPDDLHPNNLGHRMVAETVISYLERIRNKITGMGKTIREINETAGMATGQPKSVMDMGAQTEKMSGKDRGNMGNMIPLTENAYEFAIRQRNDSLKPVLCRGFCEDRREQKGAWDCFTKGFIGKNIGDKLVFVTECCCLAVQYRKTIHKPSSVAVLTIDGNEKDSILLDGNFEETWGDCLFLQPVFEHLQRKKRTITIEIVETPEVIDDERAGFYLVSLITA